MEGRLKRTPHAVLHRPAGQEGAVTKEGRPAPKPPKTRQVRAATGDAFQQRGLHASRQVPGGPWLQDISSNAPPLAAGI